MKRGVLLPAPLPAALTPAPPVSGGPGSPSLEAYRGLASWVDLFEERAWRRPGRAVADMAAHGVRTLFLETSNYSQRRTVVNRAAVGRFIEASIVDPPSRRTKRLLTLSRRIRARVGEGYPLGAIIPSPVGIELAGDYWPGFPYRQLDEIYDVFVPMGYFTYHVNGATRVRDETAQNIRMLREATGDPTVPVHLIGGIADRTSAAEAREFVRAVREHGVLGASLYNWSLTRDHHRTELRSIPTNPLQSPALPLPLPWTDPVGNLPGTADRHPKEVWFEVPGQLGSRTLTFEAHGVVSGEVTVFVNWTPVGEPAATGAGWGPTRSILVPDDLLRDARPNLIGLVAEGDHPDWSEWGVRNVALA